MTPVVACCEQRFCESEVERRETVPMNVNRSPLVAWAQSMIPPASEGCVV
jgi:hypothetical protein